jgi:hypothetical protein
MANQDKHRVYTVNGVDITWWEISGYYDELRNNNKKEADKVGDPYYNENACLRIAKMIVDEMENKIYKKRHQNYIGSMREQKELPSYNFDSLDWYDMDKVIKKAQQDIEHRDREEKRAYEEDMKNNKRHAPPLTPPIKVDWRKVLGIKEYNVDEKTVKDAFRKMAMKCHPDHGGSDAQMKEIFAARKTAYEELGITE